MGTDETSTGIIIGVIVYSFSFHVQFAKSGIFTVLGTRILFSYHVRTLQGRQWAGEAPEKEAFQLGQINALHNPNKNRR